MNISEFALKRPVFATVLNIIIVVFGVVGYTFLAVRDYPAIDPPIVTVSTQYTGANADIIESQITEPLEKQINGIQGIKSISSNSSIGSSNITIEFNLGINLDNAANDVRDKVSQSLRNLPQDIDAPPVVSKADANSDFIILMVIQSPTKNIIELTDYATNVLQQKFQTIDEVSAVNVRGINHAMRIWLNPDLMSKYNVSFSDISTALNRENIELPSGKIYGNATEITIRSIGKLVTEQQFKDLIIAQDASGMVRLSDVAKVELSGDNLSQSAKYNGLYCVNLTLTPQPGANYIRIADEFYKRLAQIEKTNKSDIKFSVLIDNTKNIKKSLEEVKETLLISFGLVVLVIFLFFRSWLIAVRPLIDIPISLVATFFIMYLCGFSINVLTLLAIVLATGLVVDDGIVVTENIFRKLEKGLPITQAALEGSKEIFFAVISTSITLAVVFLPIMFLEGFVGSLFREFGVVVASAVLISALVSLTITPVLNVVLHRKSSGHGWFYTKTEPFFEGLENGYHFLLVHFLKVRWVAWVFILACLTMVFFIYKNLQSELAPLEDKSSVRFSISTPEGSSFEFTRNIADRFVNFLYDSIPEREFTFNAVPSFASASASNTGFARLGLVAPHLRNRSQDEITQELNKKIKRFNEARIFAIQEQTISVGIAGRTSLPVQFIIQNLDFKKIKEVLPKFVDQARKEKTFQNVDVNLKFNKPEIILTVDRIKARDLGLSTADVSEAVQAAFSGRRLAYFIMKGMQYQVIAQVERQERTKPVDIANLYVRNKRGENIPLISVVNIEESSSPPALFHYNRYKSATVSASLAEGKTIGDGIVAMENIAKDLLDESFNTSLGGASRDFRESSSNTTFAFLLALALIYLVLSAQFESFKDPFIIMLTVPLAIAGALLSLWIFNQTINIFSQIGMIMLIGLVTKNGILIVEFANQKKEEGMPLIQAVTEAATQRLRPILMTSLATSLGALPIALSLGAASTSRMSLGIVIVGGIMFSLVLTLFVIPGVYSFISKKQTTVTDEKILTHQ